MTTNTSTDNRPKWKLTQEDDVDYQAMMAGQNQSAEYRDMEEAFRPIYFECRKFTQTSVERIYDLYKSTQYIAKNKIPGAFVECGVWKGGSCMVMARTLLQCGDTSRAIYLYDTFQGHAGAPPPEKGVDRCIFGYDANDEYQERMKEGTLAGWGAVTESDVIRNMTSTGYRNFKTIKGPVEETLTKPETSHIEGGIALLRLDTDWKSGADTILKALYPQLTKGGVIIFDDYGHYLGQRDAAEGFFADKPMRLFRLDYSCRTGIKLEN